MTDPVLRTLVTDEALVREPLQRTLHGLGGRLDFLPDEVRAERGRMARLLINHACAEQERALAEDTGPRPPSPTTTDATSKARRRDPRPARAPRGLVNRSRVASVR